jgi:hypothetical protein
MAHLGGRNKGVFYPRDNFILCHGIQIKKRQKLIYSTELRLKTLKKFFYAEIWIE